MKRTAMKDLGNSTRAELLRMRKWPAVWVTLGAWLALYTVFGYVFSYLAYSSGDANFATDGQPPQVLLAEVLPAAVPTALVQGTPMFGGALMMVLGALVAGSGYGWGTWKTILTQRPGRAAVTGGSILALLVFVVGLVVLCTVLSFGYSLGIAALESETVAWPGATDLAQGFGIATLILGMWALVGYALGTIARSPALSVGLGLVWALAIENLLRGVGAALSPVEALTHVLPGTAAGSLVGAFTGPTTGGAGVLDVLSGPQALASLTAYVVLVPLATLAVVRRRDVA